MNDESARTAIMLYLASGVVQGKNTMEIDGHPVSMNRDKTMGFVESEDVLVDSPPKIGPFLQIRCNSTKLKKAIDYLHQSANTIDICIGEGKLAPLQLIGHCESILIAPIIEIDHCIEHEKGGADG